MQSFDVWQRKIYDSYLKILLESSFNDCKKFIVYVKTFDLTYKSFI